jgi:3',5'-cyclic AMP phosphodiesterase CpdA
MNSSTLTWLHISDLHFRASQTYNANVVLHALLNDIGERMREEHLRPDFIAVTGDISFSGQPDEYALARQFLDELLAVTRLTRERLFVVPGNHDANRSLVTVGARSIAVALTDRDTVNTLLNTPDDRRLLMARFKGYAEFVNTYLAQGWDDEHYFYARTVEIAGRKIALLGLNSAWLCASDKDKANGLLIGERQARAALEQAASAALKIALLHHPLDWLREFDQNDSAAMLLDGCDFILHGHLHRTAATQLASPDGAAMIVASGACYETRDYPNMVNWVTLNVATGQGRVLLRRYSPERGGFWAKDTLTYKNAPDGVYAFSLRARPSAPAPSLGDWPGRPSGVADQRITSAGDHNINITGGVQGGVTVLPGGGHPSAPPSEVDLQAVRELLEAAFSEQDIITLAFDRFRGVYEDISGGGTKTEKIRRVVDWCVRNLQMPVLLAEVKQRNPSQYALYSSRLARRE